MRSIVEKHHQLQAARHPAVAPAREPTSGLTGREGSLLRLQAVAGNHAIQRVMQRKLAVNAPGDRYEQEADRVASQVMQMPVRGSASVQVQRLSDGAGAQMEAAPPSVERALTSPGAALESRLRQNMEQRFAADFGDVRVHTGPAAAQSARDVNAVAYTVGHDVVFDTGRFAPGTNEGQRLIAHELTHVVQQGKSQISVQRQPNRNPPAKAPTQAPAPSTPLKGLNRTLYVVQNDVWNKLPADVRASAEQELKRLFGFVGAATGEKPFTIKIMTAAQLPEQFDFSESVVSVIHGDPDAYVKAAFERQEEQIRQWLGQQGVRYAPPAAARGSRESADPERIGKGGGSRDTTTGGGKTFAVPVMAGAVSIDSIMDDFFENIDSLLEKQMRKLPSAGKDPNKWPSTVKSPRGTTSWQPLQMLGVMLARAIAHEARHEYVGAGHAAEGLGEEGAILIGQPKTEQFSADDQQRILDRIRELEKLQGRATVVPTFPRSMRQKPEDMPF